MTTLFVVGGTWELEPYGLCQPIVDKLSDWQIKWIQYPAAFGNKLAYRESVHTGMHRLNDELDNCDDDYALLGYSQGAAIAGNVTAGRPLDARLKKAYLIADPNRHIDDLTIGPKVEGQGVCGPRRIGPKAMHFAAAGDIICCNTNEIFEYIAAATCAMSFKNPLGWTKMVGQLALPRAGGREAVSQAHKYIKTKVHLKYQEYQVEKGVTVVDYIVNDLQQYAHLR